MPEAGPLLNPGRDDVAGLLSKKMAKPSRRGPKIRVLLNREGWQVGKYLLYTEEGLTLKRMKPARQANSPSLNH